MKALGWSQGLVTCMVKQAHLLFFWSKWDCIQRLRTDWQNISNQGLEEGSSCSNCTWAFFLSCQSVSEALHPCLSGAVDGAAARWGVRILLSGTKQCGVSPLEGLSRFLLNQGSAAFLLLKSIHLSLEIFSSSSANPDFFFNFYFFLHLICYTNNASVLWGLFCPFSCYRVFCQELQLGNDILNSEWFSDLVAVIWYYWVLVFPSLCLFKTKSKCSYCYYPYEKQ